jgi:hypothetical protein
LASAISRVIWINFLGFVWQVKHRFSPAAAGIHTLSERMNEKSTANTTLAVGINDFMFCSFQDTPDYFTSLSL